MRAALATVLWALLPACGDVVGPDQTPLCVEPAFDIGERTRVMAVYHDDDEDPVIIDDVAIVDGRGCLTLRPPPAAWFAAVLPGASSRPGVHQVRAVDDELVALGAEPVALSYAGFLIDLAVYADGDDSGDFEAPDAAGVGPDQLLTRLSSSNRAQLPFWLGRFEDQTRQTLPTALPVLLDRLAPGNQPFAITEPINATRAWRGADRGQLTRWPETLMVPPTAARTRCDIGSAWPRCRSVDDRAAFATAVLVDPRVPAEAVSRPTSGFDPVVNLPPGDGPVSPVIEARQCADVGAYRVARELTFVPRQSEDTCVCNVYVRTRWVIALADDPPDWLVCVGRPLSDSAGAALAGQVGLNASLAPDLP